MMTTANKITILRIVLMPLFIILFLQGMHPWPLIIFTFTIFTDALDGFIARWRKQTTPLGAFLDPMADKLLMFSSFLVGAYLHLIPLWIFVVILSRDLIIISGWTIMYFITGSKEVQPRFLGKLTTIFQMGTIWLMLLQIPQTYLHNLLLTTTIITVMSGLDYVVTGSKKLNHHA